MRFFNRKAWILIGLIALPVQTLADVKGKDSAQYYIENYISADENDEHVHRVHHIFEKMRLVADKSRHRDPEGLVIIQSFKEPNEPLALALPDGYIVLSQRALDIMYNGVSLAHGDTRVAFVLGHELAHLAKDDFWHREFLSATDDPELIKRYRDNDGKRKEIEADDRGFIYAAMAGYPVDQLLADGKYQQNFLVYWQQQTFQGVDETHPRPEDRAKILRARLQSWLEKLPYYHFGVRLSHFGRCDDAVYFLKEFSKDFPAREVFNNLGVCKLQQARLALGEEAYLYWLPSVLDTTTPVKNISWPYVSKGERDVIARKFLKDAKRYFKLAAEMDPSYVPAYVNMAITTFYLGDIYEARVAVEKARELAPDDLDIQVLRAVIVYEEGRQSAFVDMWSDVLNSLEKLAQHSNLPLSVLYNMARLLELRGRTGADEIWEGLAMQVGRLPVPIGEIVCGKADCPQRRSRSQKASWDLPVKLGIRTKRHKMLSRWLKSSFRLYDIFEQIYQDRSADVLALRGRIEMVVLKQFDSLSQGELEGYCGQPLRSRRVYGGILWSCEDWAALVVDEEVREVWVVKKSNNN
jgi:tetratricopeptide (TPR) repeat protein